MENQTKSYAVPVAIVVGAAIIALSLGNDRPKYQITGAGERFARLNTITGRVDYCRPKRLDVGDGERGPVVVDCSGY